MSESPILNVAISVPLSRLFDYEPPGTGPVPAPGCRVLVPFGRRQLTGLVLGTSDGTSLDSSRIKAAVDQRTEGGDTQAAAYERVTGRKVESDEDRALASWYWRNLHYAHGEEGPPPGVAGPSARQGCPGR